MSDNTPDLWEVTAELWEILGNLMLLSIAAVLFLAVFTCVFVVLAWLNGRIDRALGLRNWWDKSENQED